MSANILTVMDADFEATVLQASKPVLVDFWAEWCGPCKAIAPVLEEVAAQYQDKLIVAKVNVDHNKLIPSKYGIMSIPTLILFKDGNVEVTKSGSMSKAQMTTFLDSNL